MNCITNALVYNVFYVLSKRNIFTILFVHMFENIILTGIMIYPFSETDQNMVILTTIVLDVIFYFIMARIPVYKKAVEKI